MFVVQIPDHCLFEARFEAFLRLPIRVRVPICRIYRVSAVVSGAIGHNRNETLSIPLGGRFIQIEQATNLLDDVEIGSFVAPADVIGLADLPMFEDLA